ncbi:MAG: DUF1805 domain-containing protein [Elusimicrobia bacterium]|nr:DUF1805 domain-containing protein [Elusimicrobiota bacterium]
METRDIDVGQKKAAGFEIPLPSGPLVLARGENGFVMCGYLDIATADKLAAAAAVVRGVKNLDELLANPVTDVSAKALSMGIRPGMTGREALQKLA